MAAPSRPPRCRAARPAPGKEKGKGKGGAAPCEAPRRCWRAAARRRAQVLPCAAALLLALPGASHALLEGSVAVELASVPRPRGAAGDVVVVHAGVMPDALRQAARRELVRMTRPGGHAFDCLLPGVHEAGLAHAEEGAEAQPEAEEGAREAHARARGTEHGEEQAAAAADQGQALEGGAAGGEVGAELLGAGGAGAAAGGEAAEKQDLDAGEASGEAAASEEAARKVQETEEQLATVKAHGSAALLRSLQSGTCILRNDGYWTYEVCPGAEVRQFHQVVSADGSELKREPMYSLGRFKTRVTAPGSGEEEVKRVREKISALPVSELRRILLARGASIRGAVEKGDLVNAVEASDPALAYDETIRFDPYAKGELQQFLANQNPVHSSVALFGQEEYADGQRCDETGEGRRTTVAYRCDPRLQNARQAFIDTISEVETCTYRVVVSTPLLCAGHRAAARALWEQGEESATALHDLALAKAAQGQSFEGGATKATDDGAGAVQGGDGGGFGGGSAVGGSLGKAQVSPWAQVPNSGARLLARHVDQCFSLEDGWWTYQLCVGHYLRQYHAEGNPPRVVDEYKLGHYEPPTAVIGRLLMTSNEPGVSKHEGALIANYSGGTKCDLTGRPRRTRVLFKCGSELEERGAVLESVRETSSCEYDAVLRTPLICKHATFRPKGTQEVRYIDCFPQDGRLFAEDQPESETPADGATAEAPEASNTPESEDAAAKKLTDASTPAELLQALRTDAGLSPELEEDLEEAYQLAKDLVELVLQDEGEEGEDLPDNLDSFTASFEELGIDFDDPAVTEMMLDALHEVLEHVDDARGAEEGDTFADLFEALKEHLGGGDGEDEPEEDDESPL